MNTFKVGVLLPNCPEYAIVVLGVSFLTQQHKVYSASEFIFKGGFFLEEKKTQVLHAGLTLTTLNPAYTPHELAHQVPQ